MPDQDAMNRGTFVPPTPPKPKLRGSEDNPIEMGSGGDEEAKALRAVQGQTAELPDLDDARGDARIETVASADSSNEIGRTDTPLGTGIGYAGEGAESYGTQGATGEDARLGSTDRLSAREMADERKEETGDV